jgi:predicted DNA-binding transcriptional regulator AlpA
MAAATKKAPLTREFLPQKEVVERYGMTTHFLRDLRREGRGPRFYRPSPRIVLYRAEDIEAWLEACQKVPRVQEKPEGVAM